MTREILYFTGIARLIIKTTQHILLTTTEDKAEPQTRRKEEKERKERKRLAYIICDGDLLHVEWF